MRLAEGHRLLALLRSDLWPSRAAKLAISLCAVPYSSWQRGCNENLDGLVRQYIPKGRDIGTFTDDQIQQIEDKLNRRPRKRLGFRTPEQVFELSFKRVALRS